MEHSTRRRWLGALGTGLAVSVAGCQAVGIGGENGGGHDSGGDEPLYERWVPRTERTTLRVIEYLDYAELRNSRQALSESVYGGLAGTNPFSSGVGSGLQGTQEALDMNLDRHFYTVARGEFDADATVQALESEEYEARREDGRFTVFEEVVTVDSPHVHMDSSMAISPSYYLETPGSDSMENLLATGRGNRTSIYEGNDDVATLFDVASASTYFTANTYAGEEAAELSIGYDLEPDGTEGLVIGYEIGPERTDLTLALVFADAASVDLAGIESLLDRERLVAAYDDTAVTQEGRLGVVEGSVPTSRFNFLERHTPHDPDQLVSVQFSPYGGLSELEIEFGAYTPRNGEPAADQVLIRRNGELLRTIEHFPDSDPIVVSIDRGDVIEVVAITQSGEEEPLETFYA